MSGELQARQGEKSSTPRVDHYEVLGVSPGAGPSEIREAFEHLSAVFDPESLALYSLADPKEQREALEEVREAHRILSDPEKRRAYDEEMGFQSQPRVEPAQQHLALGPEQPAWPSFRSAAAEDDQASNGDGEEPDGDAAPAKGGESGDALAVKDDEVIQLDDGDVLEVLEPQAPAHPPIDEGTDFDGALLEAVREAKGMSRREVWERTRIGVSHIQNIEEENFHLLPSRVFLRGFLQNYAKELGLDPARVAETYLRRYEAGKPG